MGSHEKDRIWIPLSLNRLTHDPPKRDHPQPFQGRPPTR